MPRITFKVSSQQARELARRARQSGKSKSAYVRNIASGRIETTDDWLRASETRALDALIPRRRRRRRASA